MDRDTPNDSPANSRRVSRREFLVGAAATGAAVIGGVGTTRLSGETVVPTPDNSGPIADSVYTGASDLRHSLPSEIGIDFFQSVSDSEENLTLLFSAFQYPTGQLLHQSALDVTSYIQWNTDTTDGEGDRTPMQVNADINIDGGLVETVEASGNVAHQPDDGLYSWRGGGRMYNLVKGGGATDTFARLNTLVRLRPTEVTDLDETVVFTFHAMTADEKTLLRQTPPVNPGGGEQTEIGIPTDEKQFDLLDSPDPSTFHRVSRSGRHLMWYSWQYDGEQYGLVFPVHKLAYATARESDVRYTTDTYDQSVTSPYSRQIGEALFRMAKSVGTADMEAHAFHLARTFAQSWPYARDRKTHDQLHYANYAEETLVEGKGDCEDKSILLTSILEQPPFDYETSLIFPPEHIASGIAADDIPDGVDISPESVTNAGVPVGGTPHVYVESTEIKQPGKTDRDLDEVGAVYDGDWREIHATNLSEGIVRYLRQIL